MIDQHGGQAKGKFDENELEHLYSTTAPTGLGLYLKSIAQELVGKYDLHETNRLLTSLDEYDHLFRIVRLCVSHVFRNIRKANVSELVRNLMRSLVCITHSDWNNTIRRIQVEGGPAGASEFYFYSYSVSCSYQLKRLGGRQDSQ